MNLRTRNVEKLVAVKTWIRNFDSTTDPMLKRMSSLRDFLDFDMPKAIAFLTQAQKTLEAYTQIPTPAADDAAAPPVSTDSTIASPSPQSP